MIRATMMIAPLRNTQPGRAAQVAEGAGHLHDRPALGPGRLVSAEEVAAAIAYLASPAVASVTGTALAVDGGMAGLRLRPAGK